jgi:hypothetical protein
VFNIEPHADIRKAANVTFEIYTAFRQAGFTDEQAFQLARDILATGMDAAGE